MRHTTSPWGQPQDVENIAEGIDWISTASHGGYILSPERFAEMPEALRSGLWAGERAFEEDCDWCRVQLAFSEEMLAYERRTHGDDAGAKRYLEHNKQAEQTLRVWSWRIWEAYFGRELQPGESSGKDHELFLEAHKEDWLVTCAWGDCFEFVPAGFVKVKAVKGGRTLDGRIRTEGKFFMVTNSEYENNRPCGEFVIDLARHPEIRDPEKAVS